MELPDFSEDANLNSLRDHMGAAYVPWTDGQPQRARELADELEATQLNERLKCWRRWILQLSFADWQLLKREGRLPPTLSLSSLADDALLVNGVIRLSVLCETILYHAEKEIEPHE